MLNCVRDSPWPCSSAIVLLAPQDPDSMYLFTISQSPLTLQRANEAAFLKHALKSFGNITTSTAPAESIMISYQQQFRPVEIVLLYSRSLILAVY